ncbi:MAG: hypothetical protein OXG74_19760 [Acidobacteria bacterium]|nr:hypothetical protein [Acidobacteriota bacterium]
MKRLTLSFALALFAAGLGALAAPVEAQSPPRTEWGDPDLRGLWTNGTVTPLERPDELGDRTHLTEEEAEAMRGTGLQAILDRVANTDEAITTGELNEIFLEPGTEVVRSRRTSLVVDPPDGKIPYLPEGRRRRMADQLHFLSIGIEFDSHENLHVATRCLWHGDFYTPGNLYLQYHRIVQTPDHLAILSEGGAIPRVIPLDGREQLPESLRQWTGSSRGRWEGDTLVVETSNFSGRSPFFGATDGLRLVERFSRHDEDTIDYSVTVSDPRTYTRDWTLENTLRSTEGPMFEFACHEGNYGLPNILSGARHQEKLGREKEAVEAATASGEPDGD